MKSMEGLNDVLFEYTSGKWIYNQFLRLAERRLVFNVHELKKVAAKSLDRPESDVKTLSKLAEGGFNRVFEITMNDDTRVIARLPYPSTYPNRFAVASEVATLNLIRSNGIAVPKVLAYSINSENAVGSEYIIMEKVSGKSIGDTWFDLTEKQRVKVILGIVKLEAKLFTIDLPAYGSIYHPVDLPSDMGRVPLEPQTSGQDFCVGPDAALKWWYKERSLLDVERGPFVQPLDCLIGVARKERKWIQAYGKPRMPIERAYRESLGYRESSPQEHIENLEKYMLVASDFVPKQDDLSRPVLRHPDLQPNNLFVSDDFDILGIIDWQHTSILPLFVAAGIPNYIQNYRDDESVRFIPPKLPEDLDEMDEDDRLAELDQYRRRHLHFFYLGLTQRFNDLHWRAIEQRTTLLKRKVFTHAGDPWEGNNVPLKADLIRVTQHWPDIVAEGNDGTSVCLISFSDQEVRDALHIQELQEETNTQLEMVREAIGINADGWTSHERYEGAIAQAAEFKEMGTEDMTEYEKDMSRLHWPFDDHEED